MRHKLYDLICVPYLADGYEIFSMGNFSPLFYWSGMWLMGTIAMAKKRMTIAWLVDATNKEDRPWCEGDVKMKSGALKKVMNMVRRKTKMGQSTIPWKREDGAELGEGEAAPVLSSIIVHYNCTSIIG